MKKLRAALQKASQLCHLREIKRLVRKPFSRKYLLATNVILSFTISAIGDLLEQKYERYEKSLIGKQQDWDFRRTRNMGIAGIVSGVICHYWFKRLHKRYPERTIKNTVKKIFLDQLMCSPTYITAVFLTLGLLENETYEEILMEFKTKAWRLYIAEIVFSPVQFLNFYCLPTKYQVLFDNIVSLGYDFYTSRIKYNER